MSFYSFISNFKTFFLILIKSDVIVKKNVVLVISIQFICASSEVTAFNTEEKSFD